MASADDMSPGGIWQPVNRLLALGLVEDLMLKGLGPRAILARCAENGYTESIATVQSWCSEITAQWEAEAAALAPHRRNLWRARLEARYAMMLRDLEATFEALNPITGERHTQPCFTGLSKAKLYDSIAKLEALAFKLDGLDAVTVKHEHSGTLDIRAMSPDQRRERIAELLAKRNRLVGDQQQDRGN
jgi:hypothetical protein